MSSQQSHFKGTVCLTALSHPYSEMAVLKRALSIMKKIRAKRIFTPLNLDTKDLSVDREQARAFFHHWLHVKS